MIGFSFTQNNAEYVIVLPSITYTSGNKVYVGSQELEILDNTVMASLEAAIVAYQPGGSSGNYEQGYADGEAAMESAIESSQAVTANLYKSKLASEDADIAAADATDIDGQGTIFSESYQYLKTSAEMQANYNSGYSAGETAGYSAGETAGYSSGYSAGEAAGETTGYANGQSAAASSQATVAGQYKSKLSAEDADIAAADATTLAGQGTIFSESYPYLKTSAEMQANYNSGYSAGESAGYSAGESAGYTSGYSAGEAAGGAAVATNQQPIASDYKSLLSGVDQTIAAADPTTAAGQLSIFTESYQYLSTGGGEWHSDDPLCIEVLSGYGSLWVNTYEFEDFETSSNKITWTRRNDSSLSLAISSKIYIRCKHIKSGARIKFSELQSPFTVKLSGSLASLCESSSGKLTTPYEMQSMFSDTGNQYIVDASDLVLHTELTAGCYSYMFYNCTNLAAAPTLPATTLKYACYMNMFYNCRSLTTAPTLPATINVQDCYKQLFYGCSSLSSITVSTTSYWPTTWHADNWVYGVSATGTFTKPTGTSIATGTSGIPSGWTVVDV